MMVEVLRTLSGANNVRPRGGLRVWTHNSDWEIELWFDSC